MSQDPIPDVSVSSFWDASPDLQRLLREALTGEALALGTPLLAAMGRDAAQRVDALSAVADRLPPRLVSHDARGQRVDRVDYHPAYREMERIAYGSGIVAVKYDASLDEALAPFRHTLGFSLGYLFAMAEAGLFCPVCMTDGAARVLTRFGTPDQAARTVPRLASRDTSTLLTGAMFLTERWGGSDVGQNRTVARPAGDGTYLLTGEKWFCSNVDAGVILATARLEGAPTGTRGLSTFLLLAEGNPGIRIRRLKEKLGVRSMPTGEVELEGARAELVGGFAPMTEMLNLSRLYNAVTSAAVIARGHLIARTYVEGRVAFGKTVASHPLAQETLADLAAESLFALHLVFAAVRALDAADRGDAEAGRLFRVLVPIVKLVTGKMAVPCVSEAMELVGGNGYIEESPLPRLLRDAQVLPIWEGTTSILVLDTLRVARKDDGASPLLERCAVRFPGEAARLRDELPALAEKDARRWVDRVARLFGRTLLVEAGEEETARRLASRPLGLLPGARLDGS